MEVFPIIIRDPFTHNPHLLIAGLLPNLSFVICNITTQRLFLWIFLILCRLVFVMPTRERRYHPYQVKLFALLVSTDFAFDSWRRHGRKDMGNIFNNFWLDNARVIELEGIANDEGQRILIIRRRSNDQHQLMYDWAFINTHSFLQFIVKHRYTSMKNLYNFLKVYVIDSRRLLLWKVFFPLPCNIKVASSVLTKASFFLVTQVQ